MGCCGSSANEFAVLHNQFLRGCILIQTAKSINNVRLAITNFACQFSNVAIARHAEKFRLANNECFDTSNIFSYSLETIYSFNTSKDLTIKKTNKMQNL